MNDETSSCFAVSEELMRQASTLASASEANAAGMAAAAFAIAGAINRVADVLESLDDKLQLAIDAELAAQRAEGGQ
jgi:hypothetical protein